MVGGSGCASAAGTDKKLFPECQLYDCRMICGIVKVTICSMAIGTS